MPKRLRMSSADYVAIAVSPALVMALVGSLVLFMIEVLYVGDYPARLVYVFALFVFATVLIARLAIEFGSEHATLFAAPLGLLTLVALIKFVEFPSPFSHLINLALMAAVWWWAHKLTVNCTLIDDEEDASGEGLLQHVGVDYDESTSEVASAAGTTLQAATNELVSDESQPIDAAPHLWRRWFGAQRRSHPPGLWVIYFSLLALPTFGLGQHWIPPAETGRRRYAFALLAVYVAAALALLVITSFLGLRRYLRQRRIEMPAPMAANWVGVGVVVILLVMLLAALVPRPGAEYAISQVPWHVGSPTDQQASRISVGPEGTPDDQNAGQAASDNTPHGEQSAEEAKGNPAEADRGEKTTGHDEPPNNSRSRQADGRPDDSRDDSRNTQDGNNSQSNGGERSADRRRTNGEAKTGDSKNQQSTVKASRDAELRAERQSESHPGQVAPTQHAPTDPIRQIQQALPNLVGSIGNLLKILLYAVLAAIVAVFAWRYRFQIAQAIRDIVRQLRELLARIFGGRPAAISTPGEDQSGATLQRQRPFAEYRDPFATGDAARLPPEELVRYTFEAFEAWARDGGCPRSADQTPAELVRAAVPPKMELFDEARRMLRLYSEVAYASGSVTRETTDGLREMWRLMRSKPRPVPEAVAS